MSALDKLNAKANISTTKEENNTSSRNTNQKKQANKTGRPVSEKSKGQNKENKIMIKENHQIKKHAGGRKNTRGKNGEDYKMINVAVPMDVYEKLREASNGNMTFYINSVLRKSVEM